VNLDGTPIAYSCQSQGDSWFLSFTYHHSTHKIIVNLNGAPPAQLLGNSLIVWIAVIGILAPIATAVIFLAVKMAQNKKAQS
jgi:hypothetical protein